MIVATISKCTPINGAASCTRPERHVDFAFATKTQPHDKLLGLVIVEDKTMPVNVIELRDRERIVARIVLDD